MWKIMHEVLCVWVEWKRVFHVLCVWMGKVVCYVLCALSEKSDIGVCFDMEDSVIGVVCCLVWKSEIGVVYLHGR